jgi:hypothetical protein
MIRATTQVTFPRVGVRHVPAVPAPDCHVRVDHRTQRAVHAHAEFHFSRRSLVIRSLADMRHLARRSPPLIEKEPPDEDPPSDHSRCFTRDHGARRAH